MSGVSAPSAKRARDPAGDASVARQVQIAAPRYRNEIGKYRVHRGSNCIECGTCIETCLYNVHVRPRGYRRMPGPFDYRCIGFDCAQTDHYCVEACPQGAMSLRKNPVFATLGDYRWTADLIVSTWQMAESGKSAESASGERNRQQRRGIRSSPVRFPSSIPVDLRRDDISTELRLNRRGDSRPEHLIDVPWYGGGMSFGSTSINAILSRARCAKAWNTFTCTGEGGYVDRLIPYADHVITQVATGLFGVREETIDERQWWSSNTLKAPSRVWAATF